MKYFIKFNYFLMILELWLNVPVLFHFQLFISWFWSSTFTLLKCSSKNIFLVFRINKLIIHFCKTARKKQMWNQEMFNLYFIYITVIIMSASDEFTIFGWIFSLIFFLDSRLLDAKIIINLKKTAGCSCFCQKSGYFFFCLSQKRFAFRVEQENNKMKTGKTFLICFFFCLNF